MKNSKFLKAVAAITLSAVTAMAFAVTGCAHKHSYGDKWSYDDASGHYRKCLGCSNVDKQDHVYGNDNECDVCGYVKTEQSEKPGGEKPGGEQPGGTTEKIADPLVPEYTGDGEALVEGEATSVMEFTADDHEKTTYSEGWTDGVFTIGAGTAIRDQARTGVYEGTTQVDSGTYNTSVALDGTNKSFKIKVTGAGTLVLYVKNSSSGTTGTQKITLTSPGGSAETIEFAAAGSSSTIQKVTRNLTQEGEYTVTRPTGTVDLYYASYTMSVNNTPIESITVVNAGKTEYFVGQQLDCTGIAVNAIHATTGKISQVSNSNIKLDTSKYDGTKSGEYEIVVSYTVKGNLDSQMLTFTTKYTVKVYAYEALNLGFNKIIKGSSTKLGGNGTYVNHAVKQFYFKGDTFSSDGLSIIATGKLGTDVKQFRLDETKAKITGNDTSATGEKTVTVSFTTFGTTKSATFKIYIAEKPAELATADEINLKVAANTAAADVGVKGTDGAYQFKTIQQALDFLNASGAKAAAKKTITLAEGEYWEKLEVTVPNLTIVGAGADKTTIEFDSLFGEEDEGGFVHTTDSTATLNIREEAEGFEIKDVTISNKYNNKDYFIEVFGNNNGEHRALAILIQADKVVIDGCALLGYQDTIELFTGRQLIMNTYISGTTDFIFGTNNTTYFYKCTIHSISNGKTDGGYITAFKGNNKGDSDYVTYGAIFDECKFTADSDVVTNKNTALARPWAKYSAVAVINSNLDAHISTKGYDGSSTKNLRYVAWGSSASDAKPTDSTVKYVEYNNEGAGAISAAVTGMTMLDATTAANYSDLTKVFAATNGGVTYSAAWNIQLPTV